MGLTESSLLPCFGDIPIFISLTCMHAGLRQERAIAILQRPPPRALSLAYLFFQNLSVGFPRLRSRQAVL